MYFFAKLQVDSYEHYNVKCLNYFIITKEDFNQEKNIKQHSINSH